MENKEVIGTHRMPDGTEYRTSIVPDQDAQEPYDDGQWPILRVETVAYNTRVEAFNNAAEDFTSKYAELMERNVSTEPAELFERYLRIFHGVSQFRTYGPNQGTDYTYMAFDTKAWRESMGWADEAGGIEQMAGEKPLAEIQAYVEGDVWGVVTEKRWNPDEDMDDEDGWGAGGWEGIESVWGYYGREYAEGEAKSQLESLVSGHKVVPRYPEHEKIGPHQKEIDAILEFLETHTLQGHTAVRGGHQQMVFEFFGIDYDKIEAERELMIKRLQEDARE